VDRLSLDANVLFSAAYREDAGLRRLWQLDGVVLITSRYAAEEAARNLHEPAQRRRLEVLLEDLLIVDETGSTHGAGDERLPEKDRPILMAALRARATHLVTGDATHFGPFFGKQLDDVLVVPPGDYLWGSSSG
jgi:predicted nucleic acid-binding protein